MCHKRANPFSLNLNPITSCRIRRSCQKLITLVIPNGCNIPKKQNLQLFFLKKKKKKGLSKQGQEWIDEESFLYSAILCLQALGPFYIDSLALN